MLLFSGADGEIQAADKEGEEGSPPADEGEEVKSKGKKKSTRKVCLRSSLVPLPCYSSG